MTLQEVFDDLTYGELSQVSLGGMHTEGVTADKFRHITSHVKRALDALHRRFQLKTGTLTIPLVEGGGTYPLESETLPVVRVSHVLWPEGMEEDFIPPYQTTPTLPMNDEGSWLSVFTPNHRTLQVPEKLWELGARELIVVYRAGHPALKEEDVAFSPEDVEIDLPAPFKEPLLYHIASQVLNPMGVSDGQSGFHDGNNYAKKYEFVCRELEQGGYDIRNAPDQTRFERNGFV